MKLKDYLIIIPARGGSKGIPDKNIVDVGGKPLIAYSIAVAAELLTAGVSGEAIVSTDSEKIAQIAHKYGGNVPFLRPAEISGDNAKSYEFMVHAIDFFEEKGRVFDAVILLQPTTPLRTVHDVQEAVRLFESAGRPSLFSAYEEGHICDLVSYKRNGDLAIPQNPLHNAGAGRQEHDNIYVRNGAVYITDTGFLRREHKVMCDMPAMYVMPKSRSINLDSMDDLEILRWRLG